MVMVLYQNQQHANGSLTFVLGISMSKMSPILVGQLPKKVMKFSKKLSKVGILADTAYELNIHHQTVLNHSQKARFKKKLDV